MCVGCRDGEGDLLASVGAKVRTRCLHARARRAFKEARLQVVACSMTSFSKAISAKTVLGGEARDDP